MVAAGRSKQTIQAIVATKGLSRSRSSSGGGSSGTTSSTSPSASFDILRDGLVSPKVSNGSNDSSGGSSISHTTTIAATAAATTNTSSNSRTSSNSSTSIDNDGAMKTLDEYVEQDLELPGATSGQWSVCFAMYVIKYFSLYSVNVQCEGFAILTLRRP